MNRFFLDGTLNGNEVHIAVSDAGITLGRSHDCDIVVENPEVSRLHCTLRLVGDRMEVEDSSHNGTFVNGYKISGIAEVMVGDFLQVGNQVFEIGGDKDCGLAVGDEICGYRIEQCLGEGGFGAVYKVCLIQADEYYAMKVMTLGSGIDKEILRNKFMEEYKLLKRLHHDNITQVHYAGYDEKFDVLFFVMDIVLYDEKPLTLRDLQTFDECDIAGWFEELASAIDYIHRQGVVHSDIKLENILLTDARSVKLTDFGVAYLLPGKMQSAMKGFISPSAAQMIGYTEHYAAPEIVRCGDEPSVASDVYALGVMLARLLTGKWYDEDPMIVNSLATRQDFKMDWKSVLQKMLCEDKTKRETNLGLLVRQLNKNTKLDDLRKYRTEFRRRARNKLRLPRLRSGKVGKIITYKPMPVPLSERIVRALLFVALCLSLISVFSWCIFNAWQYGKKRAFEGSDFVAVTNKYGQAYVDFVERVQKYHGEVEKAREKCRHGVDEVLEVSRRENPNRMELTQWNSLVEAFGTVLQCLHENNDKLEDWEHKTNEYDICWRLDVDDVDAINSKRKDMESYCREMPNRCFLVKWEGFEKAKQGVGSGLGFCEETKNKRMELMRLLRLCASANAANKMAEGDAAIREGPDYQKANGCYDEGTHLANVAIEERNNRREKLQRKCKDMENFWNKKTESLRQYFDQFEKDGYIERLIAGIDKCRGEASRQWEKGADNPFVEKGSYLKAFEEPLKCLQAITNDVYSDKSFRRAHNAEVEFCIERNSSLTLRWKDLVQRKGSKNQIGKRINKKLKKLMDDWGYSSWNKAVDSWKKPKKPSLSAAQEESDRGYSFDEEMCHFPIPEVVSCPMRHVLFYAKKGTPVFHNEDGIKGLKPVKRHDGKFKVICKRGADSFEVMPIDDQKFPASWDEARDAGSWEGAIEVGLDDMFKTRRIKAGCGMIFKFKGMFDIGCDDGSLIWLQYKEYK